MTEPVKEKNSGTLIRNSKIRVQLAEEYGLLVPPIHVRDNLNIRGGEYRILIRGEEVASSEVYPRQILAINPGNVTVPIVVSKPKNLPRPRCVLGFRATTYASTSIGICCRRCTHCIQPTYRNTKNMQIFGQHQFADYLSRAHSHCLNWSMTSSLVY